MTVTIKSFNNEKFYVYMEQTVRRGKSVIDVGICDVINGEVLSPFRQMSYHLNVKNANATYNRYVRYAKLNN